MDAHLQQRRLLRLRKELLENEVPLQGRIPVARDGIRPAQNGRLTVALASVTLASCARRVTQAVVALGVVVVAQVRAGER